MTTGKYFDLVCDVVTHIETGRIDSDGKSIFTQAARRLLSGTPMAKEQAKSWRGYAK